MLDFLSTYIFIYQTFVSSSEPEHILDIKEELSKIKKTNIALIDSIHSSIIKLDTIKHNEELV